MMQFRIQSKELQVTLTNAVGISNYRIVVRHEVEELDADNQAGCNKLLLAFFQVRIPSPKNCSDEPKSF